MAEKGAIAEYVTEPLTEFARNSWWLVKKCEKPTTKAFQKTALYTAGGFAVMGFVGFFVKLIHIPINNIILGAS